ncbi:phospholipid carrier-dependent glycosyltransferase, partial [Sphaerisporangium rufum]|uniref:phospholipid carrier-dependent glycosyltransferase n=1 Tax=Sphaerisporangium rufum TaxID=1381558 RepID=UPI00403AB464
MGEWLFGADPFGWRFAAAVAGAVSILVVARVARRMTRSTLLGCLAGAVLALDGLHFVLSRTALLDVFLMVWVLAGFACLVADRDWARSRLAAWYDAAGAAAGAVVASAVTSTMPASPGSPGLPGSAGSAGSVDGAGGPRLGWRPWRIAAGVCLGAACAVKWSGIYFLVAFAVMSLLWDAGARRAVGVRRPYLGLAGRDLPGALAALAVVPAVTYVLSWSGWFASAYGYGRNWVQATSSGWGYFVIDSLRSW